MKFMLPLSTSEMNAGLSQASVFSDSERSPLRRDESNPGSTYSLSSSGEVDEGGVAHFTIRRSGGLSFPGEIQFQVKSGSAKKDIDFISEDGYQTISFPALSSSSDDLYVDQTISVETVQDTRVEVDESFLAMLRPSSAFDRVSQATSQVKIIDDDVISRYSLSAVNAKVTEGSPFQITINRSADDNPGSVLLSLKGSGADIGQDVADIGQREISFDAGESQKTIILDTVDDDIVETREGLIARIRSDSKNDQIAGGMKYLEINDNDQASTYSLSQPTSVQEGEDLVFTISRNGGSDRDGIVYFWTKKGTAKHSDFTAYQRQKVTIPAGSNDIDISIQTTEDELVERDESLYGFIKPFYKADSVSRASRRAEILNDDQPTEFSLRFLDQEQQVSTEFEEGSTVSIEVSRSQVGQENSVRLKLRGGSAKSGKDYAVPLEKDILFTENTEKVMVDLDIFDDFIVEGDETFFASLKPVNRVDSVSGGNTSIKIKDNDSLATYQLGVESSTVDEGNPINFIITRSGGDLTSPGKVRFRTLAGSARNVDDFIGTKKQIVEFGPGVTSVVVPVETIQDYQVERDESFSAVIRAANKRDQIKNRQQTVTVTDDDEPSTFQLSAVSSSVEEGRPFEISVSKTGGVGRTTSALIWSANGSAKSGSDFARLKPLQIDFLSDETDPKTLSIETFSDIENESSESFYLRIKTLSPSDSVVSSTLELTITDPIVGSGSDIV